MIVVDASVVVELLLNTSRTETIAVRLRQEQLHAPELLDLEVLQVIRRYRLFEQLPARRAEQAVADFGLIRIERHTHAVLRSRIWQLHPNLTAYDAAYVALAELLGSPLLTLDGKLARSAVHDAEIELLG